MRLIYFLFRVYMSTLKAEDLLALIKQHQQVIEQYQAQLEELKKLNKVDNPFGENDHKQTFLPPPERVMLPNQPHGKGPFSMIKPTPPNVDGGARRKQRNKKTRKSKKSRKHRH
jgi:hypothetical protein